MELPDCVGPQSPTNEQYWHKRVQITNFLFQTMIYVLGSGMHICQAVPTRRY